MDLIEFLREYEKVPVVEYPNEVDSKSCILTVRIATYNHSSYIRDCLESVLSQKTAYAYQIFLMEDESNDGTREICLEYAQKHPKIIRLFLNSRENNIKINGKPTGLFNAAYSNLLMDTKYIALMEGDDYWTDTDNIEKKVETLETNPGCTFCFSNGQWVDSNKTHISKPAMIQLAKSGVVAKASVMNLSIPTASLVFRNILEDKFHPEMLAIPSGDILLRAKLAHLGHGYFLKELSPTGRRIHDQGMYSSLSKKKKLEMMVDVRKKIIIYFEQKSWDSQFLRDNLCHILSKRFKANFRRLNIDLYSLNELKKQAHYSSKTIISHLFRINR